jgi:hypothetical protein
VHSINPLDDDPVQYILNIFLMQVYPEGTHFMIPWFERPIIYDVRARPNLVESTSGSRDLQMVNMHIFSSPVLPTYHFSFLFVTCVQIVV